MNGAEVAEMLRVIRMLHAQTAVHEHRGGTQHARL